MQKPLNHTHPALVISTYTSSLEESPNIEKLDSWKEIAGFFHRVVRTAQLWEKYEGLPVHRHFHQRGASVFAYRSELLAWQRQRQMAQQQHFSGQPHSTGAPLG